MIQKLHRRFLLISMLLVGVVLLLAMILLMVSSFQTNRQKAEDALGSAFVLSDTRSLPWLAQDRLQDQPQDGDGHRSPSLGVFTATVRPDGEVLDFVGVNVEVEESLVDEAVQAALEKGTVEGLLSSLQLRFRFQTLDNGTLRYAFVDVSSNSSANFQLVMACGVIYLAAMGLLLAVCWLLSRIALRPVQAAWDQQRQFVADASHELKTPLTVILANTNILAAHPNDTIRQHQKWLDYIQNEAQRMKSLVENMLFLARSDQTQMEPPMQPVNLSDCLWECLLPFEPVAFESGITLDSKIKPDCILTGNRGQLKQLVMILLDNACKYTPRGGSIQVSLFPAGEYLNLTVTNLGGEPIPPESLPHLFERFYRADPSRSREKGGYGLGLSIAATIVRTHRGRISVRSSQDAGTTFSVDLSPALSFGDRK